MKSFFNTLIELTKHGIKCVLRNFDEIIHEILSYKFICLLREFLCLFQSFFIRVVVGDGAVIPSTSMLTWLCLENFLKCSHYNSELKIQKKPYIIFICSIFSKSARDINLPKIPNEVPEKEASNINDNNHRIIIIIIECFSNSKPKATKKGEKTQIC